MCLNLGCTEAIGKLCTRASRVAQTTAGAIRRKPSTTTYKPLLARTYSSDTETEKVHHRRDMRRPLRIAVLACDALPGTIVDLYGSYSQLYERLIRKGMKSLGGDVAETELQFSDWDVVRHRKYPDPDQVDVILLSGSKWAAYGDNPWIVSLVDYVREVLHEHPTKVLGFCFGHQIVARAAGAQVGQSPSGWEMSCCQIDLTEHGRKLFGKSQLSLHQMHRDAALTLPKGYVNLGYSPKCSIQGLYLPGKTFSMQAHPEFNGQIIRMIVETRNKQGVFDDDLSKDALSRADLPYDEICTAKAVCRFLVDG